MKKLIVSLALIAPVSFALAQQPAAPAAAAPAATAPADPNKVILQVGEDKMTYADFENFIAALPPEIQEAARGDARRLIADRIVDIKLLSQEAERRGLTKQPKVEMALKIAREQALAQVMAEAAAAERDEAAMQAEYEKNKGQYEQVKARHILIRTDDSPAPAAAGKKALTDAEAKKKAEEIRARIVDKKENFADVAKAESDDTGSATRGGDLGSFTRGRMVASFEDAAFSLKPGEVSQPVKSAFGYHIIEVLERKTPTFEEVKPQLDAAGSGERVEKLVKSLKEKGEVKIDESFFGPAQPQGMPMGMPAGHP